MQHLLKEGHLRSDELVPMGESEAIGHSDSNYSGSWYEPAYSVPINSRNSSLFSIRSSNV